MSSYYQKYRPQRWQELLGQDANLEIMMAQAKGHKFSHAYLLYGPSGTGKTSTARLLAMAMNCQGKGGNGNSPCGKCVSCQAIQQGAHWDVIEVDAARCRGIEEAKSLAYKAHLTPISGGKKVYIIDEAHALTSDAFNVFLKLLEEPPPNVVIILCTTEADKIPETVKSRCQQYPFLRIKPDKVREKLEMICKREKIALDQKHLDFIVEKACGNMRAAENRLEQLAVI